MAARVKGKYRPTLSTLGIKIPAEALSPQFPGLKTKRQIGLVR
jgi:hypothetical protein